MNAAAARVGDIAIQRWTAQAIGFAVLFAVGAVLLACGPLVLPAQFQDRMTTLFIYVLLAAMWNALAGYGGLVSIGQQAFFGLGAYVLVRLSAAGVEMYLALLLAVVIVGLLSIPLGQLMLRLHGGEFAIGMWVLAELMHLVVTIDPLVQGETGTSLLGVDAFAPAVRRADTYWMALALMAVLLLALFFLLRSRIGASLQAVRDDETAAASIGVNVLRSKHVLFCVSALGCAAGGALWLATSISFQPASFFSPQWTAYMLFMTIVGGLGTFEGPVIGAVVFFAAETWFGSTGVAYLIGLGLLAIGFALLFPRGIWGALEARLTTRLIPIGYHVRLPKRARTARD